MIKFSKQGRERIAVAKKCKTKTKHYVPLRAALRVLKRPLRLVRWRPGPLLVGNFNSRTVLSNNVLSLFPSP